MLVLSRKVGESIQIAGDIRITVTEVRGGRVRLSIEAPQSVRIARQEILDTPQGTGPSRPATVQNDVTAP
ncbi:MAG: carbon storage regulator [Planctomycetota bacterium]